MTNNGTPINSIDEPGNIPICTNCDYRLDGLSPRSICPECGAANTVDVITIRGWRNPPMTTWGRGQATRAATMAIVGYMLFCLPFFCFDLVKRGFDDTQGAWMIMFAMFAVAVGLNIRLPAGRPPMRLRISAEGYELRRGPGRLHLRPWPAAYPTKVCALSKGYWQTTVGWKDPMRSGSNALQFCWHSDAADVERLQLVIDGFTQPIKLEQQPVYPQLM